MYRFVYYINRMPFMNKEVDFINEWKNRIYSLRKIAKCVGDKALDNKNSLNHYKNKQLK